MIRAIRSAFAVVALSTLAVSSALSQAMVNETRDPNQKQDEEFAKLYTTWTGEAKYGSPLVDHLPRVAGIPTPKDVLGSLTLGDVLDEALVADHLSVRPKDELAAERYPYPVAVFANELALVAAYDPLFAKQLCEA